MKHFDPTQENQERSSTGNRGHSGHGLMMLVCVALMGAAAVLLLWRGESFGGSAWLLLPMVLCLGMHVFMHRHLGSQRDREE
ncbi:hypothetical protein R5M92_15150 [Halomonas sp. Bachu 37]|uniref:hypothetical protein n=1 Tax=Halomonas kashgarensis TaxID=3084920 RepID=UPI0032165625